MLFYGVSDVSEGCKSIFLFKQNLYFWISYFEFDFPTDKVVTTIYVKSSFYPDIL